MSNNTQTTSTDGPPGYPEASTVSSVGRLDIKVTWGSVVNATDGGETKALYIIKSGVTAPEATNALAIAVTDAGSSLLTQLDFCVRDYMAKRDYSQLTGNELEDAASTLGRLVTHTATLGVRRSIQVILTRPEHSSASQLSESPVIAEELESETAKHLLRLIRDKHSDLVKGGKVVDLIGQVFTLQEECNEHRSRVILGNLIPAPPIDL